MLRNWRVGPTYRSQRKSESSFKDPGQPEADKYIFKKKINSTESEETLAASSLLNSSEAPGRQMWVWLLQ